MCTCEEMERETHACKASKLGPVERWWTQDGKLGITIPDPPPRVRKTDTFIVFYLFVLHSVMCLKTCHFAACFTRLWTSISVFYVNTARDVVTVLLIFAKYFSLYLLIFTCTYRGTRTQAHMCNQHTRGMETVLDTGDNFVNVLVGTTFDNERVQVGHPQGAAEGGIVRGYAHICSKRYATQDVFARVDIFTEFKIRNILVLIRLCSISDEYIQLSCDKTLCYFMPTIRQFQTARSQQIFVLSGGLAPTVVHDRTL